ncbi:hypothetical protein IJG72_00965 [bacterium]|nr:hypothetical protein [bacterium]
MNNDNLIFEQYKLYTNQKENFVNRNFETNRFYACFNVLLLILVFITQDIKMYAVSASCLLCITGFISCILWWINIDSYNFLIGIKYAKVIEELEKQLPVNPYTMEHTEITNYRCNKKGIFFNDVQKIFAIVLILAFFICLLINLTPLFIKPQL